MIQNEINGMRSQSSVLLFYTGNIMMDELRAGFLNTSMAKTNAEVHLLAPFSEL